MRYRACNVCVQLWHATLGARSLADGSSERITHYIYMSPSSHYYDDYAINTFATRFARRGRRTGGRGLAVCGGGVIMKWWTSSYNVLGRAARVVTPSYLYAKCDIPLWNDHHHVRRYVYVLSANNCNHITIVRNITARPHHQRSSSSSESKSCCGAFKMHPQTHHMG